MLLSGGSVKGCELWEELVLALPGFVFLEYQQVRSQKTWEKLFPDLYTFAVKDFTYLFSTFYVFYMYNFIQLKIDFCLVSQIDSFLRPMYQRSSKITLSLTYRYTEKEFLLVFFWVVEIKLYCWGKTFCLPFSRHLRSLDFVLNPFSLSSTHYHWQSHPLWWSKLYHTRFSNLLLPPQPVLSLNIYISIYWTSPPEYNRSSVNSHIQNKI